MIRGSGTTARADLEALGKSAIVVASLLRELSLRTGMMMTGAIQNAFRNKSKLAQLLRDFDSACSGMSEQMKQAFIAEMTAMSSEHPFSTGAIFGPPTVSKESVSARITPLCVPPVQLSARSMDSE